MVNRPRFWHLMSDFKYFLLYLFYIGPVKFLINQLWTVTTNFFYGWLLPKYLFPPSNSSGNLSRWKRVVGRTAVLSGIHTLGVFLQLPLECGKCASVNPATPRVTSPSLETGRATKSMLWLVKSAIIDRISLVTERGVSTGWTDGARDQLM
jgi:hypothetical protein